MSAAPVTVVDLVAAIRRRQSGIVAGSVAFAADGPKIHVRYIDEDGNEHWCTDLQ